MDSFLRILIGPILIDKIMIQFKIFRLLLLDKQSQGIFYYHGPLIQNLSNLFFHKQPGSQYVQLNYTIYLLIHIIYSAATFKEMIDIRYINQEHFSTKQEFCQQKSCAHKAFFFQQRIDFLSEALTQYDASLKHLEKKGEDLTKEEILMKIKALPDATDFLNYRPEISFLESNIFSQKQSELLTTASSTLSVDSINKIYQLPIQLEVKKNMDAQIYQVPIQVQVLPTQQEFQQYFKDFTNWSELTSGLQKTIENLVKTSPFFKEKLRQAKTLKPRNNLIDISFEENDKNSEEQVQNSFSISCVDHKQMMKNVETQTIIKQTKQCDIQTSTDLSVIQQYRVIPVDQNEEFEWNDVDFSIKKIEKILHEIPVQMQVQKQSQQLAIQTNMTNQCLNNEQNQMNTILSQVDGVLGSIQKMLYELPNYRTSENVLNYEQADICVLDQQNSFSQKIEDLKIENNLDDSVMQEAEGALQNIGKILYDIPKGYNCESSFKSIQLIDEIMLSMNDRNEQKQTKIYQIPVQMEFIQDSSQDESVSSQQIISNEQVASEKTQQEIWSQVENTFFNIERILYNKQTNVQVNNGKEQDSVSLQAQLSGQQSEYEQFLQNVKKFRIEAQQTEGIQWQQVDGAMIRIQKMFYQLPIQISPYNYPEFEPSKIKQIQMKQSQSNLESAPSSSFIEECQAKKSQLEKDWLQIDGALQNIQKALHEIPIMINDDLLEQIEQQQITHNSILINNYDIPVEIDLQSNSNQDQIQITEENVVRETIREISEPKQQAQGRHFQINQYQIPTDLELISDSFNIKIRKALDFDEQVINETVSRCSKTKLSVSQQMIFEQINPAQKEIQYFQIPVELNFVQKSNQLYITPCVVQFKIEAQINKSVQVEQINRIDITDSLEQYQLKEIPQIENSYQKLQLNFDNFSKTPQKNIKQSANTSRNNESKNKSHWLEVESSEGNLTDRSMLLRRNGRDAGYETPALSNFIKEESISPEIYYQVVDRNNFLQDQLSKFMEYYEYSNRQIAKLNSNSNKQKNFIEGMKSFYQKQKKSLKNQLNSYQNMITEINNNLQQQTNRCDELSKTIQDLQSHIQSLESVINEKLAVIDNTNENFEQERCSLWSTIRCLRVDIEESQNERECLKKEYQDIINNLKNEMDNKDDELLWVKRENNKLKVELQSQKSGNNDSKNRMTDLFGHVERVLAQKNNQQLQDIYFGQFKKSQIQIQSKDDLIMELQNRNSVLQNKLDTLIQQNQKMIKEKDQQISRLEQLVSVSEQQLSKKFSILPHIQNELDYLRKQLVIVTQQGILKEKQILQLNQALEAMKDRSVKSLSINFVSHNQDTNNEDGGSTQRSSYVKQLEQIIFEYEHIISHNQNTIKELQDQVYEYLGEALEKQQEMEALCEQVFTQQQQQNNFEESEANSENMSIDRAIEKFDEIFNTFKTKRSEMNNHGMSTIQTINGKEVPRNIYSMQQQDIQEDQIFMNANGSGSNKSKINLRKKFNQKRNQTLQYKKAMIY